MVSRLIRRTSLALLSLIVTTTGISSAETKRTFNLGYFEGGPYPVHSLLRAEFYDQLEQLLPDGYKFVTIPQGFRSADWKRDTCRAMARDLVRETSVDILIAIGPWVVHDLLEAGYDRPIIAMHQFDVVAEELVDKQWRPVAPNLTVHQRPGRIVDDLTFLSRLIDIKRLGFLFFPSAGEKDLLLERVEAIGQQLGFEVVHAEGYDNYGTYAFFKSFNALDKDIDAVYLAPMWGLETANLGQFLRRVSDAKVPSMTAEGKLVLEKGAFATRSFYSVISEAKFNASKAVRIMQGELPADLPVAFRTSHSLAVNNETALKCGIHLPEEVLSDFHVIEAPLSEGTSYFSLSDAVYRAANQNPGYLAQSDALEAAAQAARQAYSDYLPQLYSTTNLSHFDDNWTHNLRDIFSNDQYRTSINLEQQIFSLETIREIQVASKRRQLRSIDVTQSQLDLELAVSLAYLNYLRSREILATEQSNRSLIELNLEQAQAEVQIGEGDSLDVIRLEDERYQATLRVIDARAGVKIAGVLLNALFNMPGNEPFLLDSLIFSEPMFIAGEDALLDRITDQPSQQSLQNSLLAQALAMNPGPQSYRTRIDIQNDLLAKNKARYYPSIGFRASLNFSDYLEDTPTFEEENTTWSVTGFFNLPIFLGADRFRERAKLKAELSELEYLRDDASLEVMRNVQANFHHLVASAVKITPAYQSRKRAQMTLDAVVPGFSRGDVAMIDLLDAQSNALSTQLASINARYAYFETMARLVHTIGWTTSDNYSNFLEEFHRQIQN
ncbi:MAG: TolC family protein [Candidatus Zixiibacteriota bacterium]|nr:MAG: TolC family protein [candidate division Zixibacteria bacterium]